MADNEKRQPDIHIDVRKTQPGQEEVDQGGPIPPEVDRGVKHRSGNSVVKGGQNEQQGEPQPGYNPPKGPFKGRTN